MPEVPTELFSLDYEPTHQLLVGRWLRDTDDEQLYPAYNNLLAAAHRYGKCRFWLLDMHLRSWHSAAFTAWFSNLLANKVVRELGSPVFVAYVAAEAHRADIESVATDAMLRQSAQAEFYPYFFNNEAAAREWLEYYRIHPGQKPPTTQP